MAGDDGRRADSTVADALRRLGERHGLRHESVSELWSAINRGGGAQAQFDVPELGGRGQWMRGGMTMVGDMFDYALKGRVNSVFEELATVYAEYAHAASASGAQPGGWWPREWGAPPVRGGQNNTEYAWFPDRQRLLIRDGAQVEAFDTLDHKISGVSQQGGPISSVQFRSQQGAFTVGDLPRVDIGAADAVDEPQPESRAPQSLDATVAAIEALAGLHARGILTDEEYANKKADLLDRL